VWWWKARQRDDEATTNTQAATKAGAVPEAPDHPHAEEQHPLVMSAKPMTQTMALAGKPVLPITMRDVAKTQRRPRPVSPPALSGQTAATVVRAAAAMKQRRSRPRAVSPPGHGRPRNVTPRRPGASRPVSPPPPSLARAVSPTLAAQAAGNAFRTHKATGTKGRLPPRYAREPGSERPVSPTVTVVV
jgi:hypothetical protein